MPNVVAPPLTPAAWLRFDAIRRAISRAHPDTILEVGAGMGAMGYRLAAGRSYVGVEPDPRSAAVAAARLEGRGVLLNGDARRLPEEVRSAGFDVVCAFEVLEHIPDDAGALSEWAGLLRPGGHVILSVPAHRRRFGAGDDAVGHVRRYDRADLSRLLEEAGFTVELWESWGAGLGHVLEAVRNALAQRSERRRERSSAAERSSGSGRLRQPRHPVLGLASWAVSVPFRICQRPLARTSAGIGWVVMGRRT